MAVAAAPAAIGIASQAAKYLPALLSFLGRPKRQGLDPGIQRAINEYLSANPTADLSPQDLAQGARMMASGNEAIGQGVGEASALSSRRFAARAFTGPANEQAQADIAQGGAVARQGLTRDTAGFLEGIRQKTLDFKRNQLNTAFGVKVGGYTNASNNFAAQQSDYWNSMNQLLPSLASLKFPGKTGSGPITDSPIPGSAPPVNLG